MQIINEFGLLISRQITPTDLINIKAPFLFYNLLFRTNRGLTSQIYCGLVTELAKDHFSAPTKWNKIGFGYSTSVIQKAASIIYHLKLPTWFTSKLFKHNLMGYKSLGLLKALGFLESTRCKFCTTSNIDYLHILLIVLSLNFCYLSLNTKFSKIFMLRLRSLLTWLMSSTHPLASRKVSGTLFLT